MIFSRLHATCLLITQALFPPADPASPAPLPPVIPPRDIRGCIGQLRTWRQPLHLHFPLAFGIAAPFLLFRLKRLGFSNCRVVASPDGLTVTADR